MLYDTDREDLKVKVYSGLYVNEASDLDDDNNDDAEELVRIKNKIFKNYCRLSTAMKLLVLWNGERIMQL